MQRIIVLREHLSPLSLLLMMPLCHQFVRGPGPQVGEGRAPSGRSVWGLSRPCPLGVLEESFSFLKKKVHIWYQRDWIFHEGPVVELEPGVGVVLVIQDFRGHLPWGEEPHHPLALGSELPTRVHGAVTLIWL